jgi:hypothetical protein
VLDRYVKLRGSAAGGLGEHLAVSPRNFLRLGLCLRPRTGHFEEDILQIASDFGVDPFRLADVVRFVEAAEAMSGAEGAYVPLPSGAVGYLAAARARRPGGEGGNP